MAKLYRNPTTDEYYTETAMDGQFVTLRIHPEGGEFLMQQGVQEGSRIPAELLVVLEENEWVSVAESPTHHTPQFTDTLVVNESETHAPVTDATVPPDEPLPSVRMEPRPWMERENVERMQEETDLTTGDTGQPARQFAATPADRENAKPLAHPEDAAFGRNVWFWLLIAAVVVIVAWGLFEVL